MELTWQCDGCKGTVAREHVQKIGAKQLCPACAAGVDYITVELTPSINSPYFFYNAIVDPNGESAATNCGLEWLKRPDGTMEIRIRAAAVSEIVNRAAERRVREKSIAHLPEIKEANDRLGRTNAAASEVADLMQKHSRDLVDAFQRDVAKDHPEAARDAMLAKEMPGDVGPLDCDCYRYPYMDGYAIDTTNCPVHGEPSEARS